MQLRDSVVVVTGAASGIGAALVRRLAADGAAHVVAVDRDDASAVVEDLRAADDGGGPVRTYTAEQVDVTDAAEMTDLVERTLAAHGRIDLFCSNAGRTTGVGVESPELWQAAWDVNVMAQVHAARAVLPGMLERGSGYLVNTASAAGLLTSPGDAPYAVTKHGSVAFAEWLAVTYGHRGIGVSVLCPMGVATPLLMDPLAADDPAARAVAASGDIVTPEHVADVVVRGIRERRFLLLPHPEVGTFWAQKAADPDRWLGGVRRLLAGTNRDRHDPHDPNDPHDAHDRQDSSTTRTSPAQER